MGANDWFRALQVPVLPVSVGPALVGGLLGWRLSGHLDGLVLILVILSLVLVQVGANIHKGVVEGSDLGGKASRPRSAFVFDAGALGRLGLSARASGALMNGSYAVGAGMGLVVVALTGDWRLLVLGGLGAFLAYSYSGPPLKLSYFGLGEISTFLAFGPVTVVGAALAQDPALFDQGAALQWNNPVNEVAMVILTGVAIGGLTAMISFARYFPSADEDRTKGKRTPVVRLGAGAASVVYLLIAFGAAAALFLAVTLYEPFSTGDVVVAPWACQGWRVALGGVWFLQLLAGAIAGVGGLGAYLLPAGEGRSDRAVGATVCLQLVVCAGLAALVALAHLAYVCID